MSVVVDLSATAVLGTLIGVVYWCLKHWWIELHMGMYLPPGPRPVPFLGNAHQLGLEGQHELLAKWGKAYGDVVYLRVSNRPTLVLNSVEAARDLLDKRSAKYSDRPHFTLLVDMFGFDPNPALMSYGPWWRQHRVWLHSGLMEKNSLIKFHPLVRRETSKFVSALIDSPDNFILHTKRFVGGLMIEIAYGDTATSADDELITLADAVVRETMDSSGSLVGTLVDFFPALRFIPSWFPGGLKRRASWIRSMTREMYDRPYAQAKANITKGTSRTSFLSSMLEGMAADGYLTPEHEEHLKGVSSALYTGGTDTTSTVLASFFLAMTRHPEVVKKAQEEIDRVVGNSRLPDFNDRSSLAYVECVLMEVYRWNPPLYLGIPHRVMADDEYRHYHIPEGAIVVPNIWCMLRNPAWYPNAEAFQPERFQDMSKSDAENKDPRKLMFGFGRRLCPGRKLADHTLWLAIVTVLAVLDINKAHDADGNEIMPEAAFVSGGISHPKPFRCEIRLRTLAAAALVRNPCTG